MARAQVNRGRGSIHLLSDAVHSKIEPGTPVLVNWLDTVTEPSWIGKDDFVTREPAECVTVGIWMTPGENCIRLASNINENSCDGTIIPIGCVQRVTVLHGKSGRTTANPV
jgi:hypothetical protein